MSRNSRVSRAWSCRVAALAPIDGDGARVEGILGADRIEVADDIQLDPSSRLEGKPADRESVRLGLRRGDGAGVCGGSAVSVVGAAGPPSTGELVCALAEPIAHRRTAAHTSPSSRCHAASLAISSARCVLSVTHRGRRHRCGQRHGECQRRGRPRGVHRQSACFEWTWQSKSTCQTSTGRHRAEVPASADRVRETLDGSSVDSQQAVTHARPSGPSRHSVRLRDWRRAAIGTARALRQFGGSGLKSCIAEAPE